MSNEYIYTYQLGKWEKGKAHANCVLLDKWRSRTEIKGIAKEKNKFREEKMVRRNGCRWTGHTTKLMQLVFIREKRIKMMRESGQR